MSPQAIQRACVLFSVFLLFAEPSIPSARQTGQSEPILAGIRAGRDTLENVRSLYGNGAETTIQGIHNLCYYVEADQGYLSVSSYEHETRVRNVILTTIGDVTPGCRRATISGKHLTALRGMSLGEPRAKVTRVLGSPSDEGKIQTENGELFYADYRFDQARLTCQFEHDKLVLIGIDFPPAERATREGGSVVAFVEKAAVEAVNFREGDPSGLAQSRSNFTDDGWKDFTKSMQGYLDAKGTPGFTSTFVASGSAKVLATDEGMVRLRIPGTLTQSSKGSRTTYRAALDVRAGGKPPKIEKLEQITCTGSSAACQ